MRYRLEKIKQPSVNEASEAVMRPYTETKGVKVVAFRHCLAFSGAMKI